jgi:hypothetical protein
MGRAITFLSGLGSIRAAAAGTMCRTAIIDMGLEGVIDITRCELPSVALAALKCRVPVLVNNGKSLDSGIAFGEIVVSRADRAAVQLERASEEDGMVILWEFGDSHAAKKTAVLMADHFNLPLVYKKPIKTPVINENGTEYHAVRCTSPGEPLFVNGVFVGTVIGPEVTVRVLDGRISGIEGVLAKETGLARIAGLRMGEAKFKSGHIRKKAISPFICRPREGAGRMAVIDHRAFYSLDSIGDDTVCALTVGDDTTEVAGDVLARRGVRIIGITDGDPDGVLGNAMKACGSVVLQVEGITDDEAGAAVARTVGGKDDFDGFLEQVKGTLKRMGISYGVSS